MTDYSSLATDPKAFLALTGYTVAEFHALLPAFTACFTAKMRTTTLAGNPRQWPYVSYRNCPLPTLADKLLFILTYLRKATTQDIFGCVFAMAQSVANQWIHRLHDCLNQALDQVGARPARQADDLDLTDDDAKLYFQDGTERAIPRPKDATVQETYYSGKKKRHTVKNNVLVNAKGEIVLLTPTCEGKKHDKKIADEAAFTLPAGSILYQDTGFQGFALEGTTILNPKRSRVAENSWPTRKPKTGAFPASASGSNTPSTASNAIGLSKTNCATGKRTSATKSWRRCCGLHNFRLRFWPWDYFSVLPKS